MILRHDQPLSPSAPADSPFRDWQLRHIRLPEFPWSIVEPTTWIERATCGVIVDDSVKPDRVKLSGHNLAPAVSEEGCGQKP